MNGVVVAELIAKRDAVHRERAHTMPHVVVVLSLVLGSEAAAKEGLNTRALPVPCYELASVHAVRRVEYACAMGLIKQPFAFVHVAVARTDIFPVAAALAVMEVACVMHAGTVDLGAVAFTLPVGVSTRIAGC
eukprot:COSAG05_NODE_51_length_23916_cov_18.924931_8_plen_133_part_00